MKSDDLPEIEEKSANHAEIGTNDTLAYQLDLNYEDPFLKKEPTKTPSNGNIGARIAQRAQATATKIKPEKPLREIKYLGTIQNKTSGVTMAMISINGSSHVIKKGDVVEGIKIQSISQEIIKAKDGNLTRQINK